MSPKRILKSHKNAHEQVVKEIEELWKDQKKKNKKER